MSRSSGFFLFARSRCAAPAPCRRWGSCPARRARPPGAWGRSIRSLVAGRQLRLERHAALGAGAGAPAGPRDPWGRPRPCPRAPPGGQSPALRAHALPLLGLFRQVRPRVGHEALAAARIAEPVGGPGVDVRATLGLAGDDLHPARPDRWWSPPSPASPGTVRGRRRSARGSADCRTSRWSRRALCDQTLLHYCLTRGIPLIDNSESVIAVHQYHDYGHVKDGKAEVYYGKDRQNMSKVHGLRYSLPIITDAQWAYKGGVLCNSGRARTLRRLELKLRYSYRSTKLSFLVRGMQYWRGKASVRARRLSEGEITTLLSAK